MEKALRRRLELLEQKHGEPVKIWDVFRMPDGAEVRKQFTAQESSKFTAETGAELVDVIVDYEGGGRKR